MDVLGSLGMAKFNKDLEVSLREIDGVCDMAMTLERLKIVKKDNTWLTSFTNKLLRYWAINPLSLDQMV